MTTKKFTSMLFLAFTILSCNSSKKNMFEEYIKSNLGDPSSYESVEFKNGDFETVKLASDINTHMQSFNRYYQERLDIIPHFVNECLRKSELKNITTKVIETRALAVNGSNAIVNIDYFKNKEVLSKQLSENITEAFSQLRANNYNEQGAAQYEAKFKSINENETIAYNTIINILTLYGLDPSNKGETKREIVYHKYRAKNEFGALTLHEVIFIVDKSENKIIKTVQI